MNELITQCERCRRLAPSECVQTIATFAGIQTVCIVCALGLLNLMLGTSTQQFSGEETERLRQYNLYYYRETKQK